MIPQLLVMYIMQNQYYQPTNKITKLNNRKILRNNAEDFSIKNKIVIYVPQSSLQNLLLAEHQLIYQPLHHSLQIRSRGCL